MPGKSGSMNKPETSGNDPAAFCSGIDNILDTDRAGGVSGMIWPDVTYVLNIPTGQ